MAFRNSAASATVRAIGPMWETLSLLRTGTCGTTPHVGFSPNTPQKCDGMRIEPAPSEPWCSGPKPAAAAAAAPLEDPPAFRPCCQGLCVMPVSGLRLMPVQPNSGVVVLPRMTAPAAFSRAVTGASVSATCPACVREPSMSGCPAS